MEEYITLIALSYFKDAKGRYTINELTEKLGYTNIRIEELIFHLLSEGYIEYINNLLHITKKGLTFLISNEMEDFSFSTENINLIHINPNNVLNITEPYVPKDFAKKYDG